MVLFPRLDAQDVRRPPLPADIDAVLAAGFPESRARIANLLMASYQPGSMGVSGSSGNPSFTSWLTLWRWCDLLSRPGPPPSGTAPASGLPAARLKPDFAAALLRDEKFSRAFFETLSPDDHPPLVLANLQAIRDASPAKWSDHGSLAIALAVVNDEKFPAFWPHHQVRQSLVPREDAPVARQFDQWVAANERHSLLTDLRKLPPDRLKFVVDAPVAASELEWARKNVRLPRATFARVFSLVKYRDDRLKKQQYEWSDGPYLLQRIRDLGGICVDQAYFAMLCGKALGLPTLFFSGQGTDGGHAWFGYLKADEQWELNAGRYATQKFATGEALDPQTWKPISDHELEMLAARFRDQPAFAASSADLAMASLLEESGDRARAAKAHESAVRTCPAHHEAWRAQAAFLERSGAPAAMRKALQEAALAQFGTNRDLKAEHRRALAGIARETGDTAAAEKLEHLILVENRSTRADLSVGVAARQMNALLAAGKLDDAAKEFRIQLNSLGDAGGGGFFYDVVSPYVRALIEAKKLPDARRALESARKKLSPEPGSILDADLKSLGQAAK